MDLSREYNAVQDFVDGNIEQGFADKPAFIDPSRVLTYKKLQEATCKMANVLGTLKIKRETRIAMLMYDTVDFPIVFWGALRAGVIPVCLNTLLTTEQDEYMLNDSRVEALFISAELLAVVGPVLGHLPFLEQIIVVGEAQCD